MPDPVSIKEVNDAFSMYWQIVNRLMTREPYSPGVRKSELEFVNAIDKRIKLLYHADLEEGSELLFGNGVSPEAYCTVWEHSEDCYNLECPSIGEEFMVPLIDWSTIGTPVCPDCCDDLVLDRVIYITEAERKELSSVEG